tara:strand:+ start:356 stop:616 length:261 start_codon:yes stop_codon:yes gene_type:complete
MKINNISPRVYIPIASAIIILGCVIGKYMPNSNNKLQQITQEQSRMHEHNIETILKLKTNTIDDGFTHIYGITNENENLAFYGWSI